MGTTSCTTMQSSGRLDTDRQLYVRKYVRAKRQTAGIVFTQRLRKTAFSPRRGDPLHRFMQNLAW